MVWPVWSLPGALPSRPASDGQEALEKLSSFPAHVMLTDLSMPRMDGFELLRRLAVDGPRPAAIVLTAFGSIENALKTVHDLGAFWFLEKTDRRERASGSDQPRRRSGALDRRGRTGCSAS